MTRRRVLHASAALLVPATLAATVLTGCSNTSSAINREPYPGSTTAAAGGVQQVTLTSDEHDRFTPSTVTVHPGRVMITLVNTGGPPHDFSVMGIPLDAVPLTSSGQTRTATFTAPAPGRYTFVCTIHTRQGMIGTLIVLPG